MKPVHLDLSEHEKEELNKDGLAKLFSVASLLGPWSLLIHRVIGLCRFIQGNPDIEKLWPGIR